MECRYFSSSSGCRFGDSCHYLHRSSRVESTTGSAVCRPPLHMAPSLSSTNSSIQIPTAAVQRGSSRRVEPVPVEALWESEEHSAPNYAAVLRSNLDSTSLSNTDTDLNFYPSRNLDSREVCRFFLAGNCKFGTRCKFAHPVEDDREWTESRVSAKEETIECSICLGPPLGSLYGILSHCNCKFCLTCIRSWRSEGVTVTNDNEQVRLCPLCRKESYFVVPSQVHVVGEAKDVMMEVYRTSLSKKPCRYYAKGDCPFGSSCFYMHELDGSKGIEVTKRNAGRRQLSLSDLIGDSLHNANSSQHLLPDDDDDDAALLGVLEAANMLENYED